jgi:GR25 family glycosyltransferase involved in LPS biosynthesis
MNHLLPFVINLEERPERLTQSITELEKLGIKPNRFPAIKASPPQFGCILSHLYVLEICKQNNCSALVFEDDVMLINNYEEIFKNTLKELETLDFCLYYLGGNICNKITPVSSYSGKLSHCQSTHAYICGLKYIDTVISIILSNYGRPLDLVYSDKVIPNYNCYISYPKMGAVQRPSFSDIEQKFTDYTTWMEDRYSANLLPNSSLTLDRSEKV